jgi:DNA-binding transcriptional regulator YiaG
MRYAILAYHGVYIMQLVNGKQVYMEADVGDTPPADAIVPGVTGQQVRTLRKAAGLTQGGLARRLGVRRTTVYRWESGRSRVTTPMARLIRMLLKAGT